MMRTSIIPLLAQLGQQRQDLSWMHPIRRMLGAGLLERRRVMVSYPDLSGEFRGARVGRYLNTTITETFSDTLTLHVLRGQQPPAVQGSFKSCDEQGNCISGSVDGIVGDPGKTSDLNVSWQNRIFVPNVPPSTAVLHLSFARGNPNTLVGTWINGWGGSSEYNVRLEGRSSGANIPQEFYVYTWKSKPPSDINGDELNLGHLVVENCGELLLDSEVSARATCQTRIELTRSAELICGVDPVLQTTVQPIFRKQPDGNGVVANVAYKPPIFSIEATTKPQCSIQP